MIQNLNSSRMAESCHQRGFGTYQEALISIISPLRMAQVLPFPHAWFEAVCARLAEAGKQGEEHTLVEIYDDFWDRMKHYSSKETGIRECALAFLLRARDDIQKGPSPAHHGTSFRYHLDRLIFEAEPEFEYCEKTRTLSEWVKSSLLPKGQRFPRCFGLTQAHLNAADPDIKEVEYKKHELHTIDISGRTPLHYFAVRNSNEYEMAYYVKYDRELANIQDYHGYTPLHYACAFGSKWSVSELLESGAKLNLQGLDGMFPLHLTASEGNGPAIDEILQWIAKPINSSAHILRRSPDYRGFIPMHWAIMKHHENIIEKLRHDIDVADANNGDTSLHLAVQYCPSVLPIIVKHSQDLDNQEASFGRTAIHLASSLGKWKAANILLQAGANPNVCDKRGNCAKLFIEEGCSNEEFKMEIQARIVE